MIAVIAITTMSSTKVNPRAVAPPATKRIAIRAGCLNIENIILFLILFSLAKSVAHLWSGCSACGRCNRCLKIPLLFIVDCSLLLDSILPPPPDIDKTIIFRYDAGNLQTTVVAVWEERSFRFWSGVTANSTTFTTYTEVLP
jgi:hypothetical protein